MIHDEEGNVELSDTECRLLAKHLIVRFCANGVPDWEDLPALNQSAVDRISNEIQQVGRDMAGHLGNVERANDIDTRHLYEIASR